MAIRNFQLAENFQPTDDKGRPLAVGKWYMFNPTTPKGRRRKLHILSIENDGTVVYKEEHDNARFTIPVPTFKAKYTKRLTLLK